MDVAAKTAGGVGTATGVAGAPAVRAPVSEVVSGSVAGAAE
ncbi:hypothetical protein Ae505Ps2_5265c [Pseudonocardia sp. Ae505_Ps2]|nr:hypothetical protein Ae505Ps2_5265c [Pseudonocardia sp. Ae505_Ps2]